MFTVFSQIARWLFLAATYSEYVCKGCSSFSIGVYYAQIHSFCKFSLTSLAVRFLSCKTEKGDVSSANNLEFESKYLTDNWYKLRKKVIPSICQETYLEDQNRSQMTGKFHV